MNREIYNAFLSAFYTDLVPMSWDEWPPDQHLKLARSVASRILSRLDAEGAAAARDWLAAGKDERDGAVVRRLSQATNFDWSLRDDDWAIMHEVVDEVVASLTARLTEAPTSATPVS